VFSLLRQVRLLLEMIRFSHTIFALPFALMALLMAWRMPLPVDAVGSSNGVWDGLRSLAGVLLCMVGARSAAMAFNRIVDRDIDAANPRTKQRHIPRGDIGLGTAVTFLLAATFVFFAGTLCFWPNWLPAALALPVLAVLLGYSLAKRFTAWAHYWLGLALSLAPLCVWVAIRGPVTLEQPGEWAAVLALAAGVFFWVGGFDIIYACQDEPSDRSAGLHSIPVWLGVPGALRFAAASHAVAFLCFAALPWVVPPELQLSWPYFVTMAAIGMLLAYQHAIVSPTDLSRVNHAFFHVNAVISVSLLIAVGLDVWWL
jgi:4-hydroxybenzoate polyprenyltransferase